eukprot:gene16195-biopygen23252
MGVDRPDAVPIWAPTDRMLIRRRPDANAYGAPLLNSCLSATPAGENYPRKRRVPPAWPAGRMHTVHRMHPVNLVVGICVQG